VSIHRSSDGNWHCDLRRDPDAEGPGVGVPGGPAAKLSRQSALEGALGDLNIWPVPMADKPAEIAETLRARGFGHLVDARAVLAAFRGLGGH